MKTLQSLTLFSVLAASAFACGDYSSFKPRQKPQPVASMEETHRAFIKRFLDAPGFGVRRVLLPEYYRPAPPVQWDNQTFVVTPPQLIGLEEHEQAVAYVLPAGSFLKADLTNRVLRSSVKTRALDAFEAEALAALRAGQELVLKRDLPAATNQTALRALGAIRAGTACLECHGGGEGKLLGAFSYTFAPTGKPFESVPQTNSIGLAASPGLADRPARALR